MATVNYNGCQWTVAGNDAGLAWMDWNHVEEGSHNDGAALACSSVHVAVNPPNSLGTLINVTTGFPAVAAWVTIVRNKKAERQ